MSLTDEQIDRYSRQIVVPEIGGRGQERLLHSRVVLIGDSEPLRVAQRYLRGAGVDVAGAPVSGGLELLLVSRDSAARLRAFDCPLMLVDSDDGAGWYTRGTTATDCIECTLGQCAAATAQPEPHTGTTFPIGLALGAAIAIDAIKELLRRSPHSASLVQLSHGGARRRITALAASCQCRPSRSHRQRAAG